MKVFNHDCSKKQNQFDNMKTNKNLNSEAIEDAFIKLIQHAVIYEEAKKKLKLLS